PIESLPENPRKRARLLDELPAEILWDYFDRLGAEFDRLNAFLREEEVLGVFQTDNRGAGGIVFAEAAGNHRAGAPIPPPSVMLTPEHFNRLARLAQGTAEPEVELNLEVSIIEEPFLANVIAEIPGSEKRNEIVMLGGHLDSWHTGTGAT